MASLEPRPLTTAVAAGLVLGAGVLQLVASLERWAVRPGEWTRGESVEDHLFDYSFPTAPWENVGAAAQLHGVGALLLAAGIVTSLLSTSRSSPVLGVVAAAPYAYAGVHGLFSGAIGAPSPLGDSGLHLGLSLLSMLALLTLALIRLTTSWAGALAALLLVGTTVPGYLAATFVVAPIIAGTPSFDTTPWTETVVAGSALAAGVCLLIAATPAGALAAVPLRPGTAR